MEIGLIYSEKDPRQIKTRNFLRNYLKEHGILAKFTEKKQKVEIPTITINGCRIFTEMSKVKVSDDSIKTKPASRPFPKLIDIAKAIEQNLWSL